jgi:hypothetical protein
MVRVQQGCGEYVGLDVQPGGEQKLTVLDILFLFAIYVLKGRVGWSLKF